MGESLEREFKSDVRRLFTEKEIFEEVVALANTSGGVLILGVEDNGHISGAKPRHGTMTDPLKLQSAIFNNTVPSINTRVSVIGEDDIKILVIDVDPYPEICATAAGKCLRRAVGPDGKPQTIPFHPRDHLSRRIDLGLVDFSAFTLEGASFENLAVCRFCLRAGKSR